MESQLKSLIQQLNAEGRGYLVSELAESRLKLKKEIRDGASIDPGTNEGISRYNAKHQSFYEALKDLAKKDKEQSERRAKMKKGMRDLEDVESEGMMSVLRDIVHRTTRGGLKTDIRTKVNVDEALE